MSDIDAILAKLAARRPVFHSEADFQHALAWEMHLEHPAANIRLEKQVSTERARVHLDLLVRLPGQEIALELKYKTRLLRTDHGEESYALRNQSAQDIGRHDFIKDVRRLEQYTSAHVGSTGWALLLTNDRTYWTASRKQDAVDSQFRIHEGRLLHGQVTWSDKAAAGTKHKREEAIVLQGRYTIAWREFSSVGARPAETFRYVAVRVPNDG